MIDPSEQGVVLAVTPDRFFVGKEPIKKSALWAPGEKIIVSPAVHRAHHAQSLNLATEWRGRQPRPRGDLAHYHEVKEQTTLELKRAVLFFVVFGYGRMMRG